MYIPRSLATKVKDSSKPKMNPVPKINNCKSFIPMHFKPLLVIIVVVSLGSAVVGFSNNAGAGVGFALQRYSNRGGLQSCHGPLRLRGGTMSFLAAYMLLKMGGKESPTKVFQPQHTAFVNSRICVAIMISLIVP